MGKYEGIQGPWDDEPDHLEFESFGLPCHIMRTELGTLCGYVGVRHKHPAYLIDSHHLPVRVHGGVNFSGRQHGRPGLWWLGFDCAHHGDLVPFTTAVFKANDLSRSPDGVYRDIEYVKTHVIVLAAQLHQLRGRLTKKRLKRVVADQAKYERRRRDGEPAWNLQALARLRRFAKRRAEAKA